MIQIAGKEVKGVAFDLEGTIINLEPFHFAAHIETARKLGLVLSLDDPRTFMEDIPHFIGGPHEAIIQEIIELARNRGLLQGTQDQTGLAHELSDFDRLTFRELRDGDFTLEPREGFLEVFEKVRSESLPVAIGSLTDEEDAWKIIERSGLDRLFPRENIILRGDVENVKPDPEVYLKTAERMGIPPSSQLVFEDSHNGVRAARAAGSFAIGVPTVDQLGVRQRLLSEGASVVCGDWSEVSSVLFSAKSIEGQSDPIRARA